MRRERCFPCGLFGGGNRCRNMTISLKHQTIVLLECQKLGAKFTRRENSTLKHSPPVLWPTPPDYFYAGVAPCFVIICPSPCFELDGFTPAISCNCMMSSSISPFREASYWGCSRSEPLEDLSICDRELFRLLTLPAALARPPNSPL
jgi:hypothetical protein